ncbi:hypothetical protein [Streptomyces pinistramenti]|uniref:hypothetical protein n=1 Tax=Streptomyces pinistramenti TaxID=2884812 RepID=UPI001D07BF0A|nr:hypothetical protein [Streptomyces pinistramenti]MCB5911486.1 hypothetical protein [Streptomyces pinistramenti]
MSTAVTLHDLNLAAAFGNRLVVLPRGAVVAAGPPAEVLTAALIERVWGVRADADVVDGVAPIRFLRGLGRRRGPGCHRNAL